MRSSFNGPHPTRTEERPSTVHRITCCWNPINYNKSPLGGGLIRLRRGEESWNDRPMGAGPSGWCAGNWNRLDGPDSRTDLSVPRQSSQRYRMVGTGQRVGAFPGAGRSQQRRPSFICGRIARCRRHGARKSGICRGSPRHSASNCPMGRQRIVRLQSGRDGHRPGHWRLFSGRQWRPGRRRWRSEMRRGQRCRPSDFVGNFNCRRWRLSNFKMYCAKT